MASVTRINSCQINYFNSLSNEQLPASQSTAVSEEHKKDQQLLEDLAVKKRAQELNEIKIQEDAIKARLQQSQSASPVKLESCPKQVVELAQKVSTFAGLTLVVNSAQIIKSRDPDGEREHYSVSLMTEENEKVEINKWPIDVKRYGEIKQIAILDGENETILKCDGNPFAARLTKYLSTDFKVFRKEINAKHVDVNGGYPNQYNAFDCQQFAYYLKHGEEGTYGYRLLRPNADYREREHFIFKVYGIRAQTTGLGRGGTCEPVDVSIHYYMPLTDKVFVSKYGTTEVLFTSYQHILDAYFPKEFTKGNHFEEW